MRHAYQAGAPAPAVHDPRCLCPDCELDRAEMAPPQPVRVTTPGPLQGRTVASLRPVWEAA